MNHRWRHEDAADHSTLTLRKLRAVFELRHEEGAEHSRRSPGGLAHQSRELARHFGKSPRNFMPGSKPFGPNRLRLEGQEEGGTTGGMECGALLLCCCTVRCCCVVVRCVVVVVLLCCAALLCCHCPAPSSSYNTELSHHWVDTLSGNPTVTTPSCHPVVRPHSQHRKVAHRGTEVVTSQRSKPGH